MSTTRSSQVPRSRAPPRGSITSGARKSSNRDETITFTTPNWKRELDEVSSEDETTSVARTRQRGVSFAATSVAPSDSISRAKFRPPPRTDDHSSPERSYTKTASRTSSQNGTAWSGEAVPLTQQNVEAFNDQKSSGRTIAARSRRYSAAEYEVAGESSERRTRGTGRSSQRNSRTTVRDAYQTEPESRSSARSKRTSRRYETVVDEPETRTDWEDGTTRRTTRRTQVATSKPSRVVSNDTSTTAKRSSAQYQRSTYDDRASNRGRDMVIYEEDSRHYSRDYDDNQERRRPTMGSRKRSTTVGDRSSRYVSDTYSASRSNAPQTRARSVEASTRTSSAPRSRAPPKSKTMPGYYGAYYRDEVEEERKTRNGTVVEEEAAGAAVVTEEPEETTPKASQAASHASHARSRRDSLSPTNTTFKEERKTTIVVGEKETTAKSATTAASPTAPSKPQSSTPPSSPASPKSLESGEWVKKVVVREIVRADGRVFEERETEFRRRYPKEDNCGSQVHSITG